MPAGPPASASAGKSSIQTQPRGRSSFSVFSSLTVAVLQGQVNSAEHYIPGSSSRGTTSITPMRCSSSAVPTAPTPFIIRSEPRIYFAIPSYLAGLIIKPQPIPGPLNIVFLASNIRRSFVQGGEILLLDLWKRAIPLVSYPRFICPRRVIMACFTASVNKCFPLNNVQEEEKRIRGSSAAAVNRAAVTPKSGG